MKELFKELGNLEGSRFVSLLMSGRLESISRVLH